MENKNSVNEQRTIGWDNILGYGLGGMFVLGFQLVITSYYVNYFMTDVLLIPTLLAATFNTIIRTSRVVSMMACGLVIDSTHFKKGNLCTWYLISNIGLAITFPLAFLYLGLKPVAAGVYFSVFYAIQMAFYNTSWVAIRAIAGVLGNNNYDTTLLSSTTNALAGIPSLIWKYIYPVIFAIPLWAGTPNVYFGFCLFASIIIVAGGIYVYKVIGPKEVIKFNSGTTTEINKKQQKVPLKDMIKSLKGPGLIYVLAQTVSSCQGGFSTVFLNYYAIYVLKNPDVVADTIFATSLMAMVGDMIVPQIVRKVNKKTLYIGYQIITALLYLAIFLVGDNGQLFVIIRAVQTLVSSVNLCVVVPFMVDIGDYGEMMGRENSRGFLQSMAGSASRIGNSVTSIFSGFALAWIGYEANQPVSESTARGITLMMIVGPAIFATLASLIMCFYRIDEKALAEYRIRRMSESKNEV